MTLGYVDRCGGRLMVLPRRKGESGASYTSRFFAEVLGLGHVRLVTVKGRRVKTRALRGW